MVLMEILKRSAKLKHLSPYNGPTLLEPFQREIKFAKMNGGGGGIRHSITHTGYVVVPLLNSSAKPNKAREEINEG
jgi:hypothetical protein